MDADDDFEKLDQQLRAIPGIERHPVNAVPVIAPIWQLARSGISVRQVIIPGIARQVAAAKAGTKHLAPLMSHQAATSGVGIFSTSLASF